MRRGVVLGVLIVGCALVAATALAEEKKGNDRDARVALRDDCDRTDPAWVPLGGCTRNGAVNVAEFNLLLFSPLSSGSPIGHPAWRLDPTYLRIDSNETLRVTNAGGRQHTFTEVANFGGGFIPVLNGTLLTAPECAAGPPQLAPGSDVEIKGLAVGNHKFQCCIHPWMRLLVKVGAEEERDADRD